MAVARAEAASIDGTINPSQSPRLSSRNEGVQAEKWTSLMGISGEVNSASECGAPFEFDFWSMVLLPAKELPVCCIWGLAAKLQGFRGQGN